MKARYSYTMQLLLVAALAVAGGVATGSTSMALSNVSPNPSDMFALNGGVQETGGVSHMLKKETVARVTMLRLGAYYPTAAGAGDVTIGYGIAGNRCLITDIGGHFSDPDAYIRVRFSTGGIGTDTPAVTTVEYRVPIGRVCLNNNGRTNVAATGSGWTNNRFFADYPILPLLARETSTGRYKLAITIEYSNDVNEGGNLTNSVNFRVATHPTSVVAPLASTGTRELGLRNAYFEDSNNRVSDADRRGTLARVEFGIPCSATTTQLDRVYVRLYDPDVNTFGPTYIHITEDGVPISQVRYQNRTNIASFDGTRWEVTAGNGESSFRITGATPGRSYKIVVRNPNTPSSPAAPNGNVLSLFTPFDSIYGQVPCVYSLDPSISLPTSGTVYIPGQATDAQGRITNTGNMPDSAVGNHNWEIYRVKYSSNVTVGATQGTFTTANSACTVAARAGTISGGVCGRLGAIESFPARASALRTDTLTAADPPGTRLCFFTRIFNPTQAAADNNSWRYSSLVCVVVGKKPKFQVWGGDLHVGGSANTSISLTEVPTERKYGSWTEYGLQIYMNNLALASGNGLLGGVRENTSLGNWSLLTFANSGTGGNFGRFGYFTPPQIPNTVGATPIPGGILRNVAACRDVTRKIVCEAPAGTTLRIQDNIIYNGTYNSIGELPQIVLIADDIAIDASVRQIDAWLIARGRLSTCTQKNFEPIATAALTTGECNLELRFNGPVSTNELYLYRTYGSSGGANEGTPAEIFNLRGDVYLSSYAGLPSNLPIATTDVLREAPPRF